MTSTRTLTAPVRLGLAFTVAIGLLSMHGLMLPGSSMSGHQTSPHELTTQALESTGVAPFGVPNESESMHLVELCILMLATGLGLAALARATLGRSVGPRTGVPGAEARVLSILHGPRPPWTPTHLELGVVLR